MDEAHRAVANVLRVERAGEELVVRAVNRVAALEGDDVLTRGSMARVSSGVGQGKGRSGTARPSILPPT